MTPGTVQPDQRRASIRTYVAAVLVSVAFILVRQALEPGMPGQLPFLVLSAAPLLAAWYGGVGPGLLALALCAGAGQVLFARGPPNSETWRIVVWSSNVPLPSGTAASRSSSSFICSKYQRRMRTRSRVDTAALGKIQHLVAGKTKDHGASAI